MRNKLLIIGCLFISNCLGADLNLTNLQFKSHYELVTNWLGFTNYFTAHVGYSKDTNKPMDTAINLNYDWGARGCVTSNTFLDIYTSNKFTKSVLINSEKILGIEITQEKKIIYNTNYIYLKNNPEVVITPTGFQMHYRF